MSDIISKICRWCKQDKPLTEFNKHERMLDGHLNKCKSCEKEYKKQYYNTNKNGIIKKSRERNKENYKLAKRTEKYKKVRNTRRRKRYAEDLEYKIHCVLRSRLNAALKGLGKKETTIKYLGCTKQELKIYIESLFKSGMTWENWTNDGWHIDHIKPLSSFDLTNSDEITRACHYTNLQPLWANENLEKSNKWL